MSESVTTDRPVVLGGEPVMPFRPWPIADPGTRQLLLSAFDAGDWAYNTPAERVFNREFAQFQRGESGPAAYSVMCSNGTHALGIMLMAAGIGVGDEVVTTVQTWQATASEVMAVNATGRLVGSLRGTLCLDPMQVEAAIRPGKTKAVIAVHLYGSMAEAGRLREIAQRYGLALFEDCAHAQGAQWDGIGAGLCGDGGTFSFFDGKNLPAGEGGGLITRWPWLADRIDRIRNCGRPPQQPRWDGGALSVPDWWWLDNAEIHAELHGGNDRIGGLSAATALGQLRVFPELNAIRLAGKAELDHAASSIEFDGSPLVLPMDAQPHVTVPPTYAYIARYVGAEALGLSPQAIREILTADFGGREVEPPYRPLSGSDLYRPLSLRRHRLSDEYVAANVPSRYRDTVADAAWEECLMFHHTTQCAGAGDALTRAFARIVAHRDELRQRYGG